MENSKISWTDHTFNPWIGCQKVSEACDNCYAEAYDKRFHGERWGPHADRKRTSEANWRKPYKWNREADLSGERPRVFCASLADVFDNHRSINPNWRQDLWYMIRETPNLDWLLLTKRPQNIPKFLPEDWGDGYPNVWLGTTVEGPDSLNRLAHLVNVPAVVHFVSMEPLLAATNTIPWLGGRAIKCECGWHETEKDVSGTSKNEFCLICGKPTETFPTLDWVIVGGESGPSARPIRPDWIRRIRDDCIETNTAFFFKQWGGKTPTAGGRCLDEAFWDQIPTPGGRDAT